MNILTYVFDFDTSRILLKRLSSDGVKLSYSPTFLRQIYEGSNSIRNQDLLPDSCILTYLHSENLEHLKTNQGRILTFHQFYAKDRVDGNEYYLHTHNW
jgi:hypothetical protein